MPLSSWTSKTANSQNTPSVIKALWPSAVFWKCQAKGTGRGEPVEVPDKSSFGAVADEHEEVQVGPGIQASGLGAGRAQCQQGQGIAARRKLPRQRVKAVLQGARRDGSGGGHVVGGILIPKRTRRRGDGLQISGHEPAEHRNFERPRQGQRRACRCRGAARGGASNGCLCAGPTVSVAATRSSQRMSHQDRQQAQAELVLFLERAR